KCEVNATDSGVSKPPESPISLPDGGGDMAVRRGAQIPKGGGSAGFPVGAEGGGPSEKPPRPPGSAKPEDEMAQTFTGRKRVRKFFGKIQEVAEMPNLIEVQKASYDQFLLVREPIGGRPDEGLQAVFKSVFPISDFSNTSMLEFVKYEFESPKY